MKAGKTGLIYDPRMTEHKSKRKHPEKPQRVKFIMKLLEEHFYFTHPRVEYINTINRVVTDENIRLVHPEKYLKHIVNLWPKTSHRCDITVLDTYFNSKTEFCARLAIGGVLDGIDKIMKGEWENGFACVRPPGHHSGGRHTINGFCVYNNVAIGARYLQQHHNVKKVAILDWDVHHGDGTQHALQKDKNILFISIHRYDNGSFYPNTDFGNVKNQGIGEGVGYNMNIPLNYVDENFKEYSFQAPGDNEYIYLYHRIIEPVLKEFNPDFILVSSGFDAARGDPLGGFTVTPNGYYYMTKQLTRLEKPLLVVLEGGYNLNSISLSAESVMKALVKEEKFPEPMPISEHQIKYKCFIPEVIHKQIDQIIEELTPHWKILSENKDLIGYTEIVKKNEHQIFGKVSKEDSSSSSSEDNEESEANMSVNSQESASSSSSHRYNTRSKTKVNEDEKERTIELKQLEKDEEEWQKQITKMKKKEEKVENSTENNETSKPLQEIQKKEKKKLKEKNSLKKETIKEESEEEDSNDGSVIAQFYFAAGHLQKFKNFSINNEKIHKITYPEEVNFYENLTFEKEFIPKYYGKEGDNNIIIENLLYKQEDPIVVDVKLSRQSNNITLTEERREKERKKEEKSTAEEFGFRISGFTTPLYKEGGLLEKGSEGINRILKNVVTNENKKLFCDYLKKLSQALSTSSRRYYGSSILLIKCQTKSTISWVDFHYWHESSEGPDIDMMKGVNNLCKFIEELETAD